MISLLRSPIFVVGAMTLPVGLITILREALTAKFFGAGWTVDAFTVAQTLALFFVTVAGSTLGAVSVPEVARFSAAHDGEKVGTFAYALLAIGALKFLALSAIITLIAPLYVTTVGAHFDQTTQELCIDLVYVFAVFFFFSALSAQISALLNFANSYAAPALSHILIPGIACISLVAFRANAGIQPLAWGVAIGGALQCIVLTLVLVKTFGPPQIAFSTIRASLRRFASEYFSLASGAVLMGITPFIDVYMAAKLGAGSVASLAYGILIPTLAAGFLARVVAGPALSTFSEHVARGRFTGAIRSLNRYVWLCLAWTAIPTALLMGLTPLIVDALFVHSGTASADARTISLVQSLLTLQIPFYAAGIVAVRMLTALQLNRFLLAMGAANLVLKIVLNSVFMPLLGVAGIALATSVWYVIALSFSWFLANSVLSRLEQPL